MQQALAQHGRRMVTIIDPHIKRDGAYPVHATAEREGYYVKNSQGSDFDGWCWPGSSSYLDFTTPKVRDWWASLFAPDKYVGSTEHLYTWNDMNEVRSERAGPRLPGRSIRRTPVWRPPPAAAAAGRVPFHLAGTPSQRVPLAPLRTTHMP